MTIQVCWNAASGQKSCRKFGKKCNCTTWPKLFNTGKCLKYEIRHCTNTPYDAFLNTHTHKHKYAHTRAHTHSLAGGSWAAYPLRHKSRRGWPCGRWSTAWHALWCAHPRAWISRRRATASRCASPRPSRSRRAPVCTCIGSNDYLAPLEADGHQGGCTTGHKLGTARNALHNLTIQGSLLYTQHGHSVNRQRSDGCGLFSSISWKLGFDKVCKSSRILKLFEQLNVQF